VHGLGAEVEQLVEVGELDPTRSTRGHLRRPHHRRREYEKRIEFRTVQAARLRKREPNREFDAKRAAQELRDGYYVNLGIGIPTLVANYIPEA